MMNLSVAYEFEVYLGTYLPKNIGHHCKLVDFSTPQNLVIPITSDILLQPAVQSHHMNAVS